MANYKITNLKTKASIYLNKKEKERFFVKNNYFQDGKYNYKVQNIKDIRHKRTENILDYANYSPLLIQLQLIN